MRIPRRADAAGAEQRPARASGAPGGEGLSEADLKTLRADLDALEAKVAGEEVA